MNVEQERARAFRRRIGGGYRSLFVALLFFVLTSIGIFAFYMLTDNGVLTAALSIALAEFLIRARRWFHTGVESALWIGGLFAIIVDLPGPPRAEGLLLFAAASAIAGARVRNPLFGALAAGFVMHYLEDRFDAGVLFALACGTIALAALCRTWKRASNEWLWIAIAILLPVAGWSEADAQWRTATIALYAAFGVLALALAITKRHHALFFAAAIGFAIAAIEFARPLAAPLEAKFALAGAFLLGLSFALSRTLRNRTSGFVLTKESLTPEDDLIELAGTVAIQPAAQPPPETPQPDDGNFGGADASGTF